MFWKNSRASDDFFWGLILVSSVVMLPFHFGYALEVNFSVLDFVVPSLAVFCFVMHGFPQRFRKTLVVVAILSGGMILHTWLLDSVSQDFDRRWAVREVAKGIAIILTYCLTILLLRQWHVTLPSRRSILIGLAVALMVLLIQHSAEKINLGLSFIVPRTTIIASAYGLIFLLSIQTDWRSRSADFCLMIGVTALTAMLSLIALSKLGMGIGGLILLVLLCGFFGSNPNLIRHKKFGLYAALTVVLFIVTLAVTLSAVDLQRLHGFGRSMHVRLELWSFSVAGFLENYGLGIGLGQFGNYFAVDETLRLERHFFPHNTFLSFATAGGVFGVLVFGALLRLVAKAMQGFGLSELPIALAILAPLVTFHDIHGVRTFIVLVALGVYLREQQSIAPDIGRE